MLAVVSGKASGSERKKDHFSFSIQKDLGLTIMTCLETQPVQSFCKLPQVHSCERSKLDTGQRAQTVVEYALEGRRAQVSRG